MSKIKEGLVKRTTNKHVEWMVKTCDRYEKAGLEPEDAAEVMSLILMSALASVWAANRPDAARDEELICLLRRMIRKRVKLLHGEDAVNGH
jgi:hypothetical protein